MFDPQPQQRPGYSALRRFRESRPEAEYFLTINAQRPADSLCCTPLLPVVHAEIQHAELRGHWHSRSYVVMPDHLHLLVTLGAQLSLSDVVGRLKGRLAPHLRNAGLRWQGGFYDHRLRSNEEVLPVFLYIFLNPYRAGLVTEEERWPGYACCPEDWLWFKDWTRESKPFPEWLR